MATGGILGNGTKVGFSQASPLSYTTLPQLLDISDFPGLTHDKIDTTQHNATYGMKRNMPGMTDVSDLKMVFLNDPDEVTTAAFSTLFDLEIAGTTVYWRIEVPTNRAKTRFKPYIFQGWVQEVKPSAPIKDKQTLSVTVVFDDVNFPNLPAGSSVLS